MNKYQKWHNFYVSLEKLGISQDDADALRRIELTLHRWCERECCGEIEREEETNKVYAIPLNYRNGYTNRNLRYLIADKETATLKRLEKIMSKYPELWFYYQTDPRGCSLWIGKKSDLKGLNLNQAYSYGVAVCF